MKKIWVLCGGPSTEYEVSLSSAQVVCERLNLCDKQVRPVIIGRDGRWIISEQTLANGEDREWLAGYFAAGKTSAGEAGATINHALTRMLEERVDCAFLALHGQFGEDGNVQGFFETAGIPYTASPVLPSAVCFNKAVTLATYQLANLRSPRGVRASRSMPIPDTSGLNYPLFVKPLRGGSSVGLSLVTDSADLETAVRKALDSDSEAMIEERVEGVEVSCGVLDLIKNDRIQSTPLVPTEIRPLHAAFFDYEAKYSVGQSHEITPAELPERTIERIRECALAAHRVLGCEGMSRTDMIIPSPDSEPVLLETNTIPGMTPTSLLPQQCAAVGITFPDFLDALIQHALFRGKRKLAV